jgi:hypothetical protein
MLCDQIMGEACSTHRSDEKCFQNVIGKHEGKRSSRWRRRRWNDNIKMYLKVIGCERVAGIQVAQDRLGSPVNLVTNPLVLWKAGSFLNSLTTISFSKRTLVVTNLILITRGSPCCNKNINIVLISVICMIPEKVAAHSEHVTATRIKKLYCLILRPT